MTFFRRPASLVTTPRPARFSGLSGLSGLFGLCAATLLAALPAAADITVSTATVTADEGTDATVTLTSTEATDTTVTFSLTAGTATEGDDFTTPALDTVTLPANGTVDIVIPLVDDDLVEADEDFTVVVTAAATITNDTATVTITDTDIGVSVVAAPSGDEDTTLLEVTVVLTEAAAVETTVTVTPSAEGGDTATETSDFAVDPIVITIAAGELTGSGSIDLVDDALIEGDETFTVTLSAPTGGIVLDGTISTTATIVDDDVPSQVGFQAATFSTDEDSDASLTLVFSPPPSVNIDVTVDFAGVTATGGAAAPNDFNNTQQVINVLAGSATATVTVPVFDDVVNEANETFTATITAVTAVDATIDGAANTTTVTIVDDDVPSEVGFLAATFSTDEDSDASLTLVFSPPPSVNIDVTVDFAGVTATGGAAAPNDFNNTQQVINVLAGSATATVTVPVFDDVVDEANETFTATITAVTAGSATIDGAANTTTVTINDDDDPPVVSIAATLAVDEDDGNAVIGLTLSAASSLTVSVNVTPAVGTAGVADFNGTAKQVTFAPGATTATVSIPIVDDDLDEANETFTATLDTPVNATIGGANTTTVTINDDDDAPRIGLAANVSGDEGAATTIRVTLDDPSGLEVTAQLALSDESATGGAAAGVGVDFINTTINVTLPAGTTSLDVPLTLLVDNVDEEDTETFDVALINVVNATTNSSDDNRRVTINDIDDEPTVSIADVTVDEGAGTATITATLTGQSTRTIEFDVSTSNGTAVEPQDYQRLNNVGLTIAPLGSQVTTTVTIVDDSLDEANETFTVSIPNGSLTNVSAGDTTATITITDNDNAPTVSIEDAAAVTEGQTANFTVRLSAVSGQQVQVTAISTGGSAQSGTDFTAVNETVTIAAGQLTATVEVDTINDNLDEEDQETFEVRISLPVNATLDDVQGAGRINDNDNAPTVVIGNSTITEGNGGTNTIRFPLTFSAISGRNISLQATTADGTARDGRDYTAKTATITVPAGTDTNANPITFDVVINADDVHEASTEAFTVNLTAPVNVTINDGDATGTINDDDDQPTMSIADATLDPEANANMEFLVTISRPSEFAATASFEAIQTGSATAGTDFIQQSGQVFVPALSQTFTIRIPVISDAINESDETFLVRLTNPSECSLLDSEATGTIVDDDGAPSFIFGNIEVNEQASTASFSLALSASSGLDASVDFTTQAGTARLGDDFTSVGGTATILAGQLTTNIVVPIINDNLDEDDETFTVVLSNPRNAGLNAQNTTATATIRDNDASPSVSIQNVTVTEGNAGTVDAAFVISLSAPSGRLVSVRAATADGLGETGATAGSDYLAFDQVVSFSPGPPAVTSQTIVVTVNADRVAELSEVFNVRLTELVGVTPSVINATGTITNDDNAPVATADGYQTDEESQLVVDALAGVLANDLDADDDLLTATVTVGPEAAQGTLDMLADGSFVFAPALDFAGVLNLIVEIDDGANVVESDLVITVVNENDAPVLDPAIVDTVRVDEDAGRDAANAGAAIEDVLSAISDPDQPSAAGIAIIGRDDLAGAFFEVSFDDGATFEDLGPVSETSARVLAADTQTRIRLVPPENQNPELSIQILAWDQSDGASNGSLVDPSALRGGANAYSLDAGSVRFEVLPQNDPPFFVAPTPSTATIAALEGDALELIFNTDDEDGPEAILTLVDSTFPAAAVFTVDASAPNQATLRWTPVLADASNTPYTARVVVSDSLLSAETTISVRVSFIDVDNDRVPDTIEGLVGTATDSNDSDGDNISDIEELGPDPTNPPDTDGDNIIDALDTDSDNDGIDDIDEAGDAQLETPRRDTDEDGVPDALQRDSDSDGIEDGDDNCRVNANADQGDADGDLIGDVCDDDADGDRVNDRVEASLGLDPTNPDTDGDFILDGEEAPNGAPRDTDDDGTIDALDDDSDGDGILDRDEAGDTQLLTPPRDFDDDGIPDYLDRDADDDNVDDAVDNCLLLANEGQEDVDGDGNGDTCVGECGDGILHFGEECDDGNDIENDQCTSDCKRVCTEEVCDGEDNDCDGEVDLVRDGNQGLRSVCLEDIEVVGGGVLGPFGCAAQSPAGLMPLAMLALLLRRRRSKGRHQRSGHAVSGAAAGGGLAAMVLLVAGAAAAQSAQGLQVSTFTQTPVAGDDLVVVEGTGVSGHLTPTAGILFDYGNGQLRVKDGRTGAEVNLLEHRLTADLVASFSLFDRFAIYAGIPVTLYQAAGEDDVFKPLVLTPAGQGDLRFGARWSILDLRQGFGAAFSTTMTAPTGDAAQLLGNGGFTVKPMVHMGYRFGPHTRVVANLGYLVRSQQELLGFKVGNEVAYGVGGELPLFVNGLSGLLEVNGRVGADPAVPTTPGTSPLETQLAARYEILPGHTVNAGAALGITSGYGTPLARVFAGYTFAWVSADGDGDGIPDDVDRCPTIPEDEDFHEDSDGCPEDDPVEDADGDGIMDFDKGDGQPVDQCPDVPEDKDGFEDDDGCPDVDHDGDGIGEEADRCPNEPEDRDGFQDEDGCPDNDNDDDGIPDDVDRCRNAAEVRNGFEDEDGCPDVAPNAVAVAPTSPAAGEDTIVDGEALTPSTEEAPPMMVPAGTIVLPQKIYFTTAGAELTPEGRRLVDQVAVTLKANLDIRVEVQGHTDGQGDDRINDRLALRRAEVIVGYLVRQGVERPRLLITILGKSQPLAPNDTPRGRALNRRVEFRVLSEGGDGVR